jgi:class 3 adenylate cyclase
MPWQCIIRIAMGSDLPYALLQDPAALARFGGWSESVYRDFMALQRGDLTIEAFDSKYLARKAILVLDMTGFTVTTTRSGSLDGLLRILDAQKVCLPALQECGASFVRTFADDIVSTFRAPGEALDAALLIHERVADFNRSDRCGRSPPDCCIGIGYGSVYEIGPNYSMGDEMNRASKLGEDTARGGETLLTEGAHTALAGRRDVVFERQRQDDLLFPYWRAFRPRR